MDIALCSSNEFAMPMMVLMHSIMKNNNGVTFHIISCGINSDNIKILTQLAEDEGGRVEVYEPNISEAQEMYQVVAERYFTSARFTYIVYFKLLLLDILKDLDKVLVLDADIIVDGSLEELWATDFDDKYFIAASPIAVPAHSYSFKELLCYDDITVPYVNSGMILINLKELRKVASSRDIIEKAIRYAYRLPSVDQDFLNMVWHNKIKFADAKYNCVTYEYQGAFTIKVEKPVILHYAGAPKPWERIEGFIFIWHLETYLKYTDLPIFKDIRKKVLENIEANKKNVHYVESNCRLVAPPYPGHYLFINKIWDYFDENSIDVMQFLYDNNYKKIALYGLNSLAHRFLKSSKGKDLEVCCVIDRNQALSGFYYGKTLVVDIFEYTEKFMQEIDIVIIAPILEKQSISTFLSYFGVKNVISLDKVIGYPDKPVI